jgi:hypothetical protein
LIFIKCTKYIGDGRRSSEKKGKRGCFFGASARARRQKEESGANQTRAVAKVKATDTAAGEVAEAQKRMQDKLAQGPLGICTDPKSKDALAQAMSRCRVRTEGWDVQKMLNQEKGRELHKQRKKEEKEMLKRELQRDALAKATRDATAPDVVRKRDRDHAEHAADRGKDRGRDREGGEERGKAKASLRQQHVEEDAAKRRRVDAPQAHAATGHKATDDDDDNDDVFLTDLFLQKQNGGSTSDSQSDRATQASSATAAGSSSSSSRAFMGVASYEGELREPFCVACFLSGARLLSLSLTHCRCACVHARIDLGCLGSIKGPMI